MAETLERRSELQEDRPFLARLYASTREEELSVVPWTEEEKQAFLLMQFEAQRQHYREQFPEASYEILLRRGEPVGRLYVDRRDAEIRLIDIALLPECRGRGLGTPLIRQLLEEAALTERCVRIHVERTSRALSLYDRLGFRRVEDQGVYFLMEWRPPTAASPQAKTAS